MVQSLIRADQLLGGYDSILKAWQGQQHIIVQTLAAVTGVSVHVTVPVESVRVKTTCVKLLSATFQRVLPHAGIAEETVAS